MKPLVIVSDLNGKFLMQKPTLQIGESGTKPDQLDAMALAGIPDLQSVEKKHEQLVNGGIDTAAESLRRLYPEGVGICVGLSVGGVILWRAIAHGLKATTLLCFSSTRLRFETVQPPCKTILYYGEEDTYRPGRAWFDTVGLKENLVLHSGHEFYLTLAGMEIFYREITGLPQEMQGTSAD
jgi:hypothetical protein